MGSTKVETRHSGLEAGAVANLLGIGGTYSHGGFEPRGTISGQGQFAPVLFTPERFQEIIDYITTEPTGTPLGAMAAEQVVSPEALRQVWEGYKGTAGELTGALGEGLRTGFKTSIDPIERLYKRQFERELVPQLAEQFAGTSGLSSSDFGRAVAESAADLSAELGSLEFGAQESAATRRAQMAALAPSIQASLLSAPTGFAQDLLALGEEMTPGRKLLQTFYDLAGIDTGGQTFVTQEPSRAGDILGGLGGLFEGLFT